jgi:acetyl-CoA acyltransferase 1
LISPYYFDLDVYILSSADTGRRYHISRERQDDFAAQSQNKAEAAQKQGKFVNEIIPVVVNGQTISQDDGIRAGATAASLAKLKPVFKGDGTTHAGNASQLTDGAAAVILARRSVAKSLGLPILGKVVSVTTIGVPPRVSQFSIACVCEARSAEETPL